MAGWSAACGAGARGPTRTGNPLDGVPCDGWRPAGADWSSVATSRPVSVGPLRASAGGDYVYAVATWFETGTAKRQIVRSHDLGQSWCVLPAGEPVAQVAPSRASDLVIYAIMCAQGEQKAILAKTADGGATWAPGGAPFPDPLYHCGSDLVLETSVAEPHTIWFASDTLYLSRDGGDTWSMPYPPQLRPELDTATGGTIIVRHVDQFLVDPSSPARILAAGSIWRSPFALGEAHRFTTVDGGQSWGEVPAGLPSLGAGTLFTDAGGSLYAFDAGSLSRSTTWGETWTGVTLPNPQAVPTTLGSRTAGELYARQPSDPSDPRFARSRDGGATWSYLNLPAEPGVEPELAPRDASTVVGRDRFGFSFTVDGGRTWGHEPPVVMPSGVVQSPVDAHWFWAGARDPRTGTGAPAILRSDDGGLTFAALARADGGLLVMDAADGNAAYFVDPLPMRTEDGARTWTSFSVPASGWLAAAATCPGTVPCLHVLLERQGDRTDCTLARTGDRGRSWTETAVPAEICYAGRIAVAPDDGRHLVAGCFDGVRPALCDTRDGGQTWATHPVATDPDRGWASLVFTRDGIALAATDRSGPINDTLAGAVVRSTDGGATWAIVAPAGGKLATSVAHPQTLFLIAPVEGTSTAGLMRSEDGGATWTWASPRQSGFGVPALDISSVVDAPDGGFLAETGYGLVHFQ